MSTLEAIPRPGVSVLQQFETVTPTVITPTLVPCVVGVCKQIVEIVEQDEAGNSSLNSDALITLPGYFQASDATGSPKVYGGLDGLALVLSFNNKPNVTVTFSDATASGLTPATVVSQIQSAFATAGVTEAVAEVVGDAFRIRTIGVGEFQQIYVDGTTAAAVASAFGIGLGKTYAGLVDYQQYELVLPQTNFPDPRGNLDEVVIENSSLRVFLATGNGTDLLEAMRDEAFLRRSADETAAVLTGSVDTSGLSYGAAGDLDAHDMQISIDGEDWVSVDFGAAGGTVANQAAMLAAINTALGSTATATVDANDFLVITSATSGKRSSVAVKDEALDPVVTLFGTAGPLLAAGGPMTQAAVTGTVDLTSSPASVNTETLVLSINGGSNLTVSFAAVAAAADIISQINAVALATASPVVASLNGSDFLVLTTSLNGYEASIEVVSTSTALANLGLTAGTYYGTATVALIDDGNGDALSPIVECIGEDFTAAAAAATVTGTTDLTAAAYPGDFANKTLVISDGQVPQTVTFSATIADENAVVSEINEVVGTAAGGRLTASLSGNNLLLTHSESGTDSVIRIIGGTALADLGLTAGTVARGTGGAVVAGDELWVDGLLYGTVTEVAPGGTVTRLKVDSQAAINGNLGRYFYVVAQNLPTSGRPDPELVIDGDGNAVVKHDILRDTRGVSITGRASIYLSYDAVRQDVTQKASSPGLLVFDSATQLEEALSPITAENPLGLGLSFALINAPNTQVMGLGVDEISADAPFGTTDAFARAADFLEGFEVYAIAPLTHSTEVGQLFAAHVTTMSDEDNKGERIVLINPEIPTNELDTLVASGTGDTPGVGGTTFDTKITNLSALVLNAGIDPTGTIPASAGLFLDIASDAKNYSIASISGSVVTIRTTFASGENDDSFYSTTDLDDPPLASLLISEAFSVKVRGAALTDSTGAINKTRVTATVQGMAQAYSNRRVWQIIPDRCRATVNGLETLLDGFYMCAALAGMIAQLPPQQSFTNYPVSGFTGVVGSNDTYNDRQIGVMAAGGNFVIVQNAQGAPLSPWMALTTDMTAIETRTDSITKVLDFVAKFMRKAIRNFIGRFNITQAFLDSLGTTIQGLLGFLAGEGIINGGDLNNLIQDVNQPDRVLVDVTLDVPYPCNYIRLTLSV